MYITHNYKNEYVPQEEFAKLAESLGLFYVFEDDRISIIVENDILELLTIGGNNDR